MNETQLQRWQLAKFIVMGSLAALVHFVVLYLAVSIFHIAPAWGNVIAFLCAFCVSFAGHLNVTFKSSTTASDGRVSAKLIKWFATSLAGFALNQSLFMLGLHWLGDGYYLLVWLMVTILVTICSFLLGKLWAFK